MAVISNASGSKTETVRFPVQFAASVTVSEYVPANMLDKSCVFCPESQTYKYGDVPPLTLTSMEPSAEL